MSVATPRLIAVVFDWAGTLVDHGSRAPVEAMLSAFESEGLTLTEAQARGPMGLGKRDHVAALLRDPDALAAWRAGHGRDPDDDDVERLYAAFATQLPAAVARYVGVIPGVVDAVMALREQGIGVGSTTGYTRSTALAVAEAARRQGLAIDVIVASDEVPAGRPAPWMAWRVLEALATFPASWTVKVGDTSVDMAEGRNAGMWCVGITDTGNEVGLGEEALAALAPGELMRLRLAAEERLRDAGAHEVLTSAADTSVAVRRIDARLAQGERP